MKRTFLILLFDFLLVFSAMAQLTLDQKGQILNDNDYEFLKTLTQTVMDSSRIYPGEHISPEFGPNNTGDILIRPGGRTCYPSFWIRDYSMSLESGFTTKQEQKHLLLLTASTQCDQTRITKGGSLIPFGAIADHIRIDDGLPIYFPGTYSFEDQGNGKWGKMPPYGDQFFFIQMAYFYVKNSGEKDILTKKINGFYLTDRLEIAFSVPPSDVNHIVYTTDEFRGVDFGFRDVEVLTGKLCMPTILKYRAANQLSEIFGILGNQEKADKYHKIAASIQKNLPDILLNDQGMLLASTGKCSQPDVWSTALAIYYGILQGEYRQKACQTLADAYKSGTLAYHGNIRHLLTTDDFSEHTAWEISYAAKNTYQNGAYWGTPTGWVCYAIAQVDFVAAQKLASEYINDLRHTDFRKGGNLGGPYECFYPPDYHQNPVYLTTVTCPFAVFSEMR